MNAFTMQTICKEESGLDLGGSQQRSVTDTFSLVLK